MIEIKRKSMDSMDAKVLIQELNKELTRITGNDGTSHFNNNDLANERSVFLIGYVDDIPYACGALRELSADTGELKRIYARKNSVGIGHKIVEALENEAASHGYHTLLLETRIQNKHAIQFYQKNGYSHCQNYGVYVGKTNAYCFKKDLLNM